MKTHICIGLSSRFIIGLLFAALIVCAAGCLHDQQAMSGDSEATFSNLILGALAVAGNFARALLAAFLF